MFRSPRVRLRATNHHFVDAKLGWYPYNRDMTAVDFRNWLAAMKISGAEAARLLDVKPNTITRYRRNGAPKAVGLACAALFHRLEEWAS